MVKVNNLKPVIIDNPLSMKLEGLYNSCEPLQSLKDNLQAYLKDYKRHYITFKSRKVYDEKHITVQTIKHCERMVSLLEAVSLHYTAVKLMHQASGVILNATIKEG